MRLGIESTPRFPSPVEYHIIQGETKGRRWLVKSLRKRTQKAGMKTAQKLSVKWRKRLEYTAQKVGMYKTQQVGAN